jgi:hypothetical protein
MVDQNEVYRNFYRRCAEDGDYLTLDNSSFEIGDGVYSPEQLIDFALDVGATEVMAPEVYLKAEETVKAVEAFIDEFNGFDKANELKIFATIHGKSWPAAKWCFERCLRAGATTIGLSCRLDFPYPTFEFQNHYNEAWRRSLVRMNFARKVYHNLKPKHRIHLLGMNHPYEISFYHDMPLVKSNDSSAAWLNGIELNPLDICNYRKPEAKMDFDWDGVLTEAMEDMVDYNINFLMGIVNWELHNDIKSAEGDRQRVDFVSGKSDDSGAATT